MPPRTLTALLVLILVTGAVACGGDGEKNNGAPSTGGADRPVDVLGIWENDELVSFEAMVEPWDGEMRFTGTRDITALLAARVTAQNPPDVAIPAEIGLFQQFAREGKLTPLSDCSGLDDYVRANYPQSFIDLGTVDGTLYGIFMKADTKATIWYDPKFFREHNLQPLTDTSTFDDLVALSTRIRDAGTPPWSIGQEAGAGSGFPGSDTIQQIVLNQQSENLYDDLVAGRVAFTDAAMVDAWQKFGQIALTQGFVAQGSGSGINATAFMDSSYLPFQDPPQAAMVHLGGFTAGFIKGQFPAAVPGDDYDFFPWPGGKVTGGANIAYAFNSDISTCSFLSHIASADAQKIWVERGGFTAVNRQVSLDAYPDTIARKLAAQLVNVDVFQFDLDDAIGGAAQQAEFQGVTQFLTNPEGLASILRSIDDARSAPQ